MYPIKNITAEMVSLLCAQVEHNISHDQGPTLRPITEVYYRDSTPAVEPTYRPVMRSYLHYQYFQSFKAEKNEGMSPMVGTFDLSTDGDLTAKNLFLCYPEVVLQQLLFSYARAPSPLPELKATLKRVLREYERHPLIYALTLEYVLWKAVKPITIYDAYNKIINLNYACRLQALRYFIAYAEQKVSTADPTLLDSAALSSQPLFNLAINFLNMPDMRENYPPTNYYFYFCACNGFVRSTSQSFSAYQFEAVLSIIHENGFYNAGFRCLSRSVDTLRRFQLEASKPPLPQLINLTALSLEISAYQKELEGLHNAGNIWAAEKLVELWEGLYTHTSRDNNPYGFQALEICFWCMQIIFRQATKEPRDKYFRKILAIIRWFDNVDVRRTKKFVEATRFGKIDVTFTSKKQYYPTESAEVDWQSICRVFFYLAMMKARPGEPLKVGKTQQLLLPWECLREDANIKPNYIACALCLVFARHDDIVKQVITQEHLGLIVKVLATKLRKKNLAFCQIEQYYFSFCSATSVVTIGRRPSMHEYVQQLLGETGEPRGL